MAVVIDVFRAFTVSAYALAAGARECVLVRTVEEALDFAERTPGAVVSAEIEGKPVPGIPLSNSPTMLSEVGLKDRVLIQRTSAGTQGVAAAAEHADKVVAASLVVLSATAELLRRMRPRLVTLVATGEPDGHFEDRECSELLATLLQGQNPDVQAALERIRGSEHFQFLHSGAMPGFPRSDLDLALAVDRFDFALGVELQDGVLRLRAVSP